MFIIARNQIYADLCIAIIWLNPKMYEMNSPLDVVTSGVYRKK